MQTLLEIQTVCAYQKARESLRLSALKIGATAFTKPCLTGLNGNMLMKPFKHPVIVALVFILLVHMALYAFGYWLERRQAQHHTAVNRCGKGAL